MLKPWIVAVKPGSLPKIILPLLAGFSVGVWMAEAFSSLGFILLLLYGLSLQIFIVLMNDVADADADCYHMKHYPHLIDERMIPTGQISKRAMFTAGCIAALLCLATAVLYAILLGRLFAPVAALVSVLILTLYSFGPYRFNYRGMGELFEALGVGIVLPLSALYFTSGKLVPDTLAPFILLFLLALASALSSGLKHMPSDKKTGKRTYAVLYGLNSAKNLIVALSFFSLLIAILFSIHFFTLIGALFLVLIPGIHFYIVVRYKKRADIEDLKSLGKFKYHLHRLIFTITTGVALTFLTLSI
ncbi:prenyltransferase [Chitinispirillales bacterium ANBcel5]|uniref:prenyltransferase n=1 Tax=Cellulosispirillum alkaliphilum TaxID=3039283 RepID=UPI002A539B15|nr:prenyltransferase [Chitinispirillales bacterium ANBcel5]